MDLCCFCCSRLCRSSLTSDSLRDCIRLCRLCHRSASDSTLLRFRRSRFRSLLGPDNRMRSRYLHNRSSCRRTVANRASTAAALLHHTAPGAFHATGGAVCSSGLLSGLLLFIFIHDLMEALALFTGCILRVKNSDQSFLFLYRFCFLLSLCRAVFPGGFGLLRFR